MLELERDLKHLTCRSILCVRSLSVSFQELLSLAKRKRVDSEEPEEPVSKPAASTDSETSDSDDEVLRSVLVLLSHLEAVLSLILVSRQDLVGFSS